MGGNDGFSCRKKGAGKETTPHCRYNAACIVTKNIDPGERFEKVPRVIIVYISEKDFLGYGKTIYHIDKVIRETGIAIDDGLLEVFVNMKVDDKTRIAELMKCFNETEIDNPKFPKLSRRAKFLKESEGGMMIMCDVMEEYMEQARQEERVKERARTQERFATLINHMVKNNDTDKIEQLQNPEFLQEMLNKYGL